MKIINFGSCNIDYVYSLNHIVLPGETESSSNMEIFPGGKGLNQSIAAARAGADVYHAGCIGEDGQLLIDVLRESGVKLSYISLVNGKNGHAIIQLALDGENSIFLYPGSNQQFTTDYIDEVLSSFSEGDIVMLQNEINLVDYIVEKACERGLEIVLNPSPFNEIIATIDLNKVSYLVLNEVEARGFTGSDCAKESLKYFKENYPSLNVMLTLGGQGCIYMDEKEQITHHAFKVDVVDTTAAGDTFTGYFVAGLAAGENMQEILRVSSASAALAVSKKGAAPSIPYREEVLHALETQFMRG